jgi:hypothetical protein
VYAGTRVPFVQSGWARHAPDSGRDERGAAQIQGAALRRALAEADRSRIAEYRAEAEARARGSTHGRYQEAERVYVTPEPTALTTSTEAKGDDHAANDERQTTLKERKQ